MVQYCGYQSCGYVKYREPAGRKPDPVHTGRSQRTTALYASWSGKERLLQAFGLKT
jgi:hypothetical protein